MRAVIPRLLIAVILFIGAWLAWREAALARRVAAAHSRLATLHFDADDGIAEDESPLNRVAVPVLSLDQEIREHRARSGYWRTRTENGASDAPAVPLPGARGGNQSEPSEGGDPEVMFVATNSAFRAATRQTTDRPRTVDVNGDEVRQFPLGAHDDAEVLVVENRIAPGAAATRVEPPCPGCKLRERNIDADEGFVEARPVEVVDRVGHSGLR